VTDQSQLLFDELARVFARAAVEALLRDLDAAPETKTPTPAAIRSGREFSMANHDHEERQDGRTTTAAAPAATDP
jgi:hypothetical protein